ncbi:guanine nucleotide-binding protein subunit beta-like protein isoform X2 [Brachypodium distachyon]|uniref:guanine nucleotide-binding protein subunit beta-like protein isoform X2 n=1 Tax=Brachypodium distachyon TaxID=15368 RepID=UPI00071C4146|nr:guanine nucleotide-binding protein subunit beta-like protein isoform X2 [Brachypodium distachyon]|eukprot:XP_024314329.1 guanine nucleotide-binding protein subunit beta-like protein isoform X2 [Brachypodium distachyon]
MSPPPPPSGRTLVDLDGDVLAHCARHLGARDVASLAMACRPLHAAAYCDAVWEQWPFQQVPCGALGLRELYIQRHTEVHQMKFDDPLSSIYYQNPIGSTPSHLLLDKNRVCFSQGPVAKILNVTLGSLDNELVETYRSHSARITCMRLFPLIDTPLFRSDTHTKEKALVTSSTDRTVRLCWKGCSRSYKGHSGPVTALADKLLCDGEFKVLATGGEDCAIRLWSMSTKAKSHSLISTLHGHEKTLSLLSVAWHKSSLLVSSSKDSKVKVWDTMAPPSSVSSSCVGGTHLNSSGPPIAMKCHQSLCYIAAGSEVTAIDLRTMKKASVLALCNQRIISCEMLPSEWLICTGVKDKALLWDIRKSQELANTVAELHSDGPVTLLHLDPYKVVTGAPLDGQVHVWETQTGRLVNTLSCGEPGKSPGGTTVSAMAVDGCRIATTESSAEGILLHYRDFMSSSVPVALPGKEVSKFWGPQEYADGASEDED